VTPNSLFSLSDAQLSRRHFLRRLSLFGVALGEGAIGFPVGASGQVSQRYRAAIIGHTGHGNYGHQHEMVFKGRPNVTLVALADPDEAGRSRAAERTRALRQYADYREMIAKEKPDLVCVATRWTDQHFAMGLTALRAGAHLYIEKPITQTLVEADELLRVAQAKGLKIAVAHQMRLAPNILLLKDRIAEGWLGELLEIRAHGKQDHRAGGEDLIVLGVHIFDLMRFFAGDAAWCSARVLQQGREVTKGDAHAATENIGLILGDEIFAQFAFAKGVNGTFTSSARNREAAGPWGMELIGSKRSVRILLDIVPRFYGLKDGQWTAGGKRLEWEPLDEVSSASTAEENVALANQRVVDDWLKAIEERGEPTCSGFAAMKALEMAMAVFQAGLTKGRVELPLKVRDVFL
jgi:predicted dehydrogenase